MSERQHTRVIVMVHSHIKAAPFNGVIDLSPDVIALDTSKVIKGVGGFGITLVPRHNYFNYLFPNDVVNIYIDPGDGKRGFIRTMMGYIDRIDRTEGVDQNGAVSTVFKITGTDFAKAIDKTEIYFNPHLTDRPEFRSFFGGPNVAGSALRSRGLVAHGTPADIVENMLELLLGFGGQWVLPDVYPKTGLNINRQNRRQRAVNRVSDRFKDLLQTALAGTGSDDFQQDPLSDPNFIPTLTKALNDANQKINQGGVIPATADGTLAKQAAISEILASDSSLLAFHNIMLETNGKQSFPFSLLDLLDMSFIEHQAIDGYVSSAAIWQGQGTLASLLFSYSNEMVNELCFDLRPVSADEDSLNNSVDYSKDEDDCGGINVHGTAFMPPSVSAVKYEPAVVFREYPYSVVEGLDLTNYFVLGSGVGFVPFGPVFSLNPKQDGNGGDAHRYLFDYGTGINPEPCLFDQTSKPVKILDTIAITSQDTTGSNLGRSDHEIFNLTSIYANDVNMRNWKYILRDFSPIFTPVSCARHGLRTRDLNTRFANYGRDHLCDKVGSAVDNSTIRRNLIRWALLIDHWYQHNAEYLSGTINLRGMPEIRVGYRLDWIDRHESYYVEAVNHQWQYPGALRTSIKVSRGQRNDNFPAYVPPVVASASDAIAANIGPSATAIANAVSVALSNSLLDPDSSSKRGGNRNDDGRLADFFPIKDTRATSYSTQGEAKFQDENTGDNSPNADRGQNAEYAQQFAKRTSTSSPTTQAGVTNTGNTSVT